MARSSLVAPLVFLALLAGSSQAREASFLRFAALHREGCLELRHHQLRGIKIEGFKVLLKDNHLEVWAREAWLDAKTHATGVYASTNLVMDDQFWLNPVTGVVKSFLKAADITVERLELSWDESPAALVAGLSQAAGLAAAVGASAVAVPGSAEESIAVKQVHVACLNNRFDLDGHSIVNISSTGTTAWTPATRKITATVESVKAAGLPVPLGLAFGLMKKFIDQPFIELAEPNLLLDVGYFLK